MSNKSIHETAVSSGFSDKNAKNESSTTIFTNTNSGSDFDKMYNETMWNTFNRSSESPYARSNNPGSFNKSRTPDYFSLPDELPPYLKRKKK